MELERGICSLCSETSSKVLPRSEAENICKFLPKILQENFLTESEFQKIKDSIKICILCYYKIKSAQETKEAIRKAKGDSKEKLCHFCSSDETVIKLKSDAKFFALRLEGFVKPTDFPVCVCPSCLFYLDNVFNMKAKLILKFPQLVGPKPSKASAKQNETPKRKSQTISPQSSAKKRKIFDDCFMYLKPLSKNKYYVPEKLRKDKKMYRKIAYVNLEDSKNVKETPRTRPVIKIKLKMQKPKKTEKNSSKRAKEKDEEEDYSSDDYAGFSSAPFVQSGKSEEKKRKTEKNEEKNEKTEEENLNETPKAAAASANTVPKRRVSLFAEANDADSDDKEKETQSDSEEINKVVNKYIKDSTFDDDNKLDLLREVGEDSAKLDNNIEENGVEKAATETSDDGAENKEEEKDKSSEHDSEETSPEDGKAVTTDNRDEATTENNDELSSPSKSNSSLSSSDTPARKTPPGSDASDEESDSDDESEKRGNRDVDRDSLNGSEKKKKRVTFSDDIN